MTRLAVSRMFRAAVIGAIENLYADPHTMAAVDLLSDGFQNGTTGMLEYLWQFPDGVQWGGLLGIEYSPKKQAAVLTITGKPWHQWLEMSA